VSARRSSQILQTTGTVKTNNRSGNLFVSNPLSGGGRELHKVPALGNPTHSAQIFGSDRASTGERQRRAAVQGGMAASRVVVGLELAKLPFKVMAIPEQHLVAHATCITEELDPRFSRDPVLAKVSSLSHPKEIQLLFDARQLAGLPQIVVLQTVERVIGLCEKRPEAIVRVRTFNVDRVRFSEFFVASG
jgi:hypothetical protein